jgi:hypothetical protein
MDRAFFKVEENIIFVFKLRWATLGVVNFHSADVTHDRMFES